ncbi:cell motility protein [Mycobacterium colombiense]|uniref:PE family protein n=1 Tax=Mycobacterium colombiense TaxID=339268 RepID=UPI00096D8F59|nr:PE family protein [Mycobacterium colombiense]OMC25439.1 cell motility protein [Mycobacterium colombiense]OMC27492.1 cell motility protein [Mycobacterium colombiense]
MTLRVIPEGLAATSSAVDAITAQLAAAHAAAAPVVSVVVPPAADPVSLAAAAVFSERGSQHSAAAAKGVEVLGRAGLGVSLAGVNYVTGDTAAASTYLGA